ncbi:3'-5' exonuclease [Salibacteraceae bacterium]|nr:3'-5' exonuclease [Salibacteraceae bacterium]
MRLILERPIAFIDLETTGLSVGSDRIVEIAILKINPDGSKTTRTHRVNPEMHISEESTSIHGISDADLETEPTFADLGPSLFKFLFDCDLAGYNSNKFDIPMLVEEFYRVGIEFDFQERSFVDVQNVFHKMEQRTLKAAYKFYCEKELENAHSAEADIIATYEVMEAQLEKYDDLQGDIPFLSEFSRFHNAADIMGRIVYNADGIECVNFGKQKGVPVEEVFTKEPGYYGWLMKGDFPKSTKKVFSDIMARMKSKSA